MQTLTLEEAIPGDDIDGGFAPTSLPLARGNAPAGETWICLCGASVATNLHPRQLLNIGIDCPLCRRELRTPKRAVGEPIGGRPMHLSTGRYRIEKTLDVGDVAIVGTSALAGYGRETGLQIPGVFRPTPIWEPTAIDAPTIRRLGRELVTLLGTNYAKLHAADLRGRRSATPPRQRQRVIQLIRFAEETEKFGLGGGITIDGDMLSELICLTTMMKRWRNHPGWHVFVQSLTHESEPLHSVMLLTVASYLADSNNGVGLHLETARGKVPDLWLAPGLTERVDVEVKTPQRLRSPDLPLSPEECVDCVVQTMRKASKQLRGANNLLVIGGFHLGTSIDRMEAAAHAVLASSAARANYVGILIADITFESKHNAFKQYSLSYEAGMEPRLVTHAGYTGALTIGRASPIGGTVLGAA
jgi:hypothetical protein